MPHRPDQSTIARPHVLDHPRQPRFTDSAARRWDEEVRRAGLEAPPSKVMNVGVPVLAIGILKLALIMAIFFPEGGDIRPFGILLILLAMAPWAFWLYVGDEGPHGKAVFGLLFPIALLAVGHWFAPSIGPGSDFAYPALAFPPLLLTIIAVAIAPVGLATGTAIAAWAVMGVPLIAALASGKDVTGTEIVTWHVAVALSVVAGYAVRFNNHANTAVTVARELMIRQEASDERRQIARDVHDVVAHSLSVTLLHVTAARLALNRQDNAAASHALEEAERLGRSSMADIRRIVQVLRADGESSTEMPQPTVEDLDDLVRTWQDAGLEIESSIDPAIRSASATSGMTLYRILQEALTNAARYGDGHATVDIRQDGDAIRLIVTNPAPNAARTASPGSGTIGMQERAEAVGGSFSGHIEKGMWVVEAHIPNGEREPERHDPRPSCR